MFYVYIYFDAKDNTPRYVGKGKDLRYRDHLKRSCRTEIGNLLKKRVREGYQIEPCFFYFEDEQQAFNFEQFWISYYGRKDLAQGTLFNRTNGGDGHSSPSEETRKLLSEKAKLRRHSEETKKTIGEKGKGRIPWNKSTTPKKPKLTPEELIERRKQYKPPSQKGKKWGPMSEEAKEKRRQTMRIKALLKNA